MGGATAEISLRTILLKRLTITGSTLRIRTPAEKGAIAAALEQRVWPAARLRPRASDRRRDDPARAGRRSPPPARSRHRRRQDRADRRVARAATAWADPDRRGGARGSVDLAVNPRPPRLRRVAVTLILAGAARRRASTDERSPAGRAKAAGAGARTDSRCCCRRSLTTLMVGFRLAPSDIYYWIRWRVRRRVLGVRG